MAKHAFILGSFVTSCSAMVDRFPKKGESFSANGFILEPGGKGFNLILALTQLAIPVEAIVAVGNDLAGHIAPSLFAEAGLPTHYIVKKPGQTGGGVCFTDATGETSLAIFNGANDSLSASDIAAQSSQIANACVVAAPFEVPDEAIRAAFTIARKNGVTTLLNPSPFRPISAEILDLTDILIVNQSEAEALNAAPITNIDVAHSAQAQALPVQHIIVTLGKDGADYYRQGAHHSHSPARPSQAIDSLGAGDAFTSGVIAGLSQNFTITAAIRLGHECAGRSVEIAGTSAAYASLADLTVSDYKKTPQCNKGCDQSR